MLAKKWIDYLDKPSWPNRIVFYFVLLIAVLSVFGAVILIFRALFPDFSILNNTIYTQYNTTQLNDMGFFDNERYLLSALVQSLAAVIALVITLSLVAVQLAAQSYSARVIDVYKRKPDMWILLSIYIITIFYGLGLIKIIGLGVLSNYTEGAIFTAYFMGFFAFICLVPYMLKTLDLLKPSTVIKLLSEDITKENILESLKIDEEIEDRDTIQPIIDMINRALERNDYETARNGLTSIANSIIFIFKNTQFESEEEAKLSNHITLHIERLGIQALNKQNEDSTLSAIVNLERIGTQACNNGFSKAVLKTIDALEIIGKNISETDFENLLQQNIKALGEVGAKAIKKNYEDEAQAALTALMDEGAKAAEKNLGNAAAEALKSIGYMGTKAAENELGATSQVAAFTLQIVGTESIKNDLDIAAMVAARELGNVGIKAAENKLKTSTAVAARALGDVGIKAAPIKFGIAAKTATEKLGDVGAKAAEKELEEAKTEAEKALKALLKKANENKWDIIVKLSTEGLKKIEQKSSEDK
ncbi:DUF2254 family protein [Methanolobus sp. ZRKC2]|uniref:DUF2254 family protein n=1 Tax=Methanolobus sp. ZRKC2 TaxID=3125783 RepID=UPI0032495C2D